MKRISWFLMAFFIMAPFCLKAQTPEGATQALNYAGLEKKLKTSEADIQDPKKSTKVKTWISRADLMINIYNVHNDLLRKGMDPVSVKLFFKEPKEIQTSQEGADKIETYVYDRVNIKFRNGVVDSWTDTKPIHPDPLTEASKAIDEANKLNADGKADKDITNSITNLKACPGNEAVFQYEKKNFKGAHDNFIKILDLNKYPQMKNIVDTIYYYYGGRAALEDSNYAEANRIV